MVKKNKVGNFEYGLGDERRKYRDFYYGDRWSINDREYKTKLLNALITIASDKGKLLVPKPAQYLLSEVMNGTIASLEKSVELEYGTKSYWNSNEFEIDFFNYFTKKFENIENDDLNSKIKQNIVNLCTPFWVDTHSDPYSKDYLSTALYELHHENFGKHHCSTIELSVIFIEKANKDLNELSELEKQSVIQIGEKMMPMMEKDIQDIKRKYRW